MKRFLVIFLLALTATATAEVFRHVGPDGQVSFSDRPAPGAESVDVGPLQTIQAPPAPRSSLVKGRSPTAMAGGEKSAPGYSQLSIVEPTSGQSVRANDGSVTVVISLQPALVPGHTIELVLDSGDAAKVYSGASLNFNLSALSRGEHQLVARVKNGRDEKLIETPALVFYVQRVAAGG